MCRWLKSYDYLPETRMDMGENLVKLAHWLTVTSWGVAFHAYLVSEAPWDRFFVLAIVSAFAGSVVFIIGLRKKDKARRDIRAQKRFIGKLWSFHR
jgi:hypothetical protein